MALSVGINENVILTKAEVSNENDKTCLILNFREKGKAPVEQDRFAQLSGDGVVQTGTGTGDFALRVWPPLPPLDKDKSGNAKTVVDMGKEAFDNVGEVKNILHQILSCFTTSDKIKLPMFQGMDDVITRENMDTELCKEPIIKQCFLNLANHFVEQVAPFLDKEDCAVRLLLVRQSKEKHYATLRSRFVNDNPFIEPAVIPLTASKLKFTKYEMTNGFNDGTPTAQAAGDTTTADAPPAEVANLFDETK